MKEVVVHPEARAYLLPPRLHGRWSGLAAAALTRLPRSRRLRRIAAALRVAPDRLLHRLRRRAARARVARIGLPSSVLVICHGNICRSPYAAAALAARLGGAGAGTRVESAGFVGAGRMPPAEALAAAGERGIDLGSHRSRVLTAELVRSAELIVVMDPRQDAALRFRFGVPAAVVLGDLDPAAIARRAIHDPVNQPREAFDDSYRRIDRCVEALVAGMLRARQRA